MLATETQRVVAIVVCHNGRPFIRDALRGLTRQSRPIDDLIVVDTGSRDGTSEWTRSHLSQDSVLSVRGQFGRAVMIALRHPRVRQADWLWLLHDDCAPEPDALAHLLAEASYTPAAGVLGPKLVGWDDPDQLQEVGFWIDRAAHASSPIEDREIDQGQHDHLSEVFFVSTAGMLVRRRALEVVGGFDTRMPAFRDDLDLCWRVHLMGGRVLLVPQARVRHFRAATVGSRLSRKLSRKRYLIERHALASVLKCTALRRLPHTLASALLAGLIRMLGLLVTGRFGEAGQILVAWGWNIKELPSTLRLRRQVQSRRRVTDQVLTRLRAPGGQRVRSVFRALGDIATTDPGGTHASTADMRQVVRRIAGRHPAAAALAIFVVVMALSLRALLLAQKVGGQAMPTFPGSARDFFAGFTSSLGTDGLGSTLPASPSLVVYGLAAVVAFGKGLLAQKLLLWIALPLAAATCARALRVIIPDLRARLVGGLLYATTPLATAALSQGRLGELAFLVLAPPLLAQVWLALELEQPREPWRPALRFSLLLALAVALYPPALLIVGVIVAVAAGIALAVTPSMLWNLLARRVGLLGLGLLGAIVVLLPWSVVLFTAGSPLRGAGVTGAVPSFADLIQLRPGGPGQPLFTGPLYPTLALAGLIFAAGARRMLAFWFGLGLLCNALLAAWQARSSGLRIADWPGGVLIPGAVAWAAIAAIGFNGILPALTRARSNLERAGATFVAVLTALVGVLVAGNLARGDWALLDGPEKLPATVTESQARVLWLAGRGDGGVFWAVTGPRGRTLLDTARPAPPNASAAVGDIVLDVLQARTHRAGTLLRTFNIGFVVVRHGPGEDRLNDVLTRQGDLDSRVTEQAGLYEGPPPAPGGLVLPGGPPQGPEQLLLASGAATPLEGGIPSPQGTVKGPATVLLPVSASGSWQAEIGDGRLQRDVAAGWAQAFRVPAGVTGTVKVHYEGQRPRTLALVGELLVVLAALAMIARPTRRPPPPTPSADEVTGELRLPAAVVESVR
ncbi:MAG TPA: glycosyltransferase family 2 protein [Actinomycetes bacterium]|nr:glycosyltransferase family 2 protein [Actinomycetes bacterium]